MLERQSPTLTLLAGNAASTVATTFCREVHTIRHINSYLMLWLKLFVRQSPKNAKHVLRLPMNGRPTLARHTWKHGRPAPKFPLPFVPVQMPPPPAAKAAAD